MWAKCNLCDARIILPEDRAVVIKCLGQCDFNCVFELDYETYPHGELQQLWYIKEADDDQEDQ